MKFISVIFLLTALIGHTKKVDPCLIIEEKSITINGNTSLGGFSCDYVISGKNDTLLIDNLSSSPYSFSIPVEAFKCGNFLLNRDFRYTLKAEEYPRVSVQVLSLEEIEQGTFAGCIRLTLVGKSKTLHDVSFCMKPFENNNRQILSASFVFNASEFELTPPRKLGGLITTDDAMNITVSLVLKPAISQGSLSAN